MDGLNTKIPSTIVVWIALLALFVLVYLPVLPADFFSTDDDRLLGAPQLTEIKSIGDALNLFRVGEHVDYYPIRDLSYSVDLLLWPDSPELIRLHQILLFGFCGLLLSLILVALGVSSFVASFGAAIWLFHPYHAETIVWISARKDVLSIFFGLLTAYFFILGLRKNWRWGYLLSFLVFGFSLFSKANFGPLPLAVLVGCLMFQRRIPREALITLVALSVLGVGFSAFFGWFYSTVNDMRQFLPWSLRIETSITALGRLIGGLFWSPWNSIDSENFGKWNVFNRPFFWVGSVSVISAIFLGAIGIARRSFLVCLALLGAGSLYAPTSGLVFPHRYLYSVRYFEPVFLFLAGVFIFQIAQSKILSRILSRVLGPNRWLFFWLFMVPSVFWTFQEVGNWESNDLIRKKSWNSSRESLSLQTFLWSDLYNLKIRNRITPEDLTLFQQLEENLNRHCMSLFENVSITDERINCINFVRHKLSIQIRLGNIQAQEKLIGILKFLSAGIKPAPNMLERELFEMAIRTSKADIAQYASKWLERPYFPNVQYRTLQLLATCYLGREKEAQDLWLDFLAKNLINHHLFLENLPSPIVRQKESLVFSCLEGFK